jgi:2-dehydro-3-deoxygluconokinase
MNAAGEVDQGGQRVVDILALGEPMVEFNQTGEVGGRTYLQGFGGDTSNFAIAAARQGANVGYISALGADHYGQQLRALWAEEGVDQTLVTTNELAYTAIYFVHHGPTGHQFDFFRKGSAASLMTAEELPLASIRAAKVLHLSGISLAISASARACCFAAMAAAQHAGVTISFDTNLRLKLWPRHEALQFLSQAIGLSDLCLPSIDDITAITGVTDPEAVVQWCLDLGAKTVALKMGAQGALLAHGSARYRIEPFPCQPVDATGAGDTFAGALVARLVQGATLESAGQYAAAAAALSTQGYGAVAPIPFAPQVRKQLLLRTAPTTEGVQHGPKD